MRTNVLSRLPLRMVMACAVAVGCDGEIRPPKQRPGGAEPPAVGSDPGGSTPGGAVPSTSGGAVPSTSSGASAPEGDGDQRAIGGLSTDELVDVCRSSHDNLARALAAQVQIDCTASSLGQGGGCESARQKCVGDNQPEPEDAQACEMEAPTLAQDCATVTVAALRSCEEAWIRRLEGAAEQLGCGTPLERFRERSDLGMPPECQNVDTRCSAQ